MSEITLALYLLHLLEADVQTACMHRLARAFASRIKNCASRGIIPGIFVLSEGKLLLWR